MFYLVGFLATTGQTSSYYHLAPLNFWSKYCETCMDSSRNLVSCKTFCTLWQQLVPYVVIMKPMTDLCWQCQQNNTLVLRTANSNSQEKSEALQKHWNTSNRQRENECSITPPMLSAEVLLEVLISRMALFILLLAQERHKKSTCNMS